ncbi:MAG: UxaA family hydrolase [Acidimicrobiales bacterium]
MTSAPLFRGVGVANPASPALLVRLAPDDDVAVAVADLVPGQRLEAGEGAVVRDPVPTGHKVALRAVGAGQPVHKYGQVIGFATAPMAPGDHVHSHNLAFAPFTREHHPGVDARPVDPVPDAERATFDGIVRPDGRVATRNYLAVVTSVNCSATAARLIARRMAESGVLADHPGVDGVVALTHTSGCGMALDGEGMAVLRRVLGGYARHPNVAGVLLLGLGCEANQVGDLAASWDVPASTPVEVLTIQEEGGTRAVVAEGVQRLTAMLDTVGAVRRQPVPASHLVLGLECGGSDAFSGVTANPALGAAADLLVGHGGTAVLGETPEIYGAEHLLTRRAASPEVAEALMERIRWWEAYTASQGASLDNNPSPGNKAGGLTTILEKSLGAVAKGGTTPLTAVHGYAERVAGPGLVFMDTPGYDPVSVTGMVAGGANVVCFTTGRGSAYGCKPVPSLKLATTSDLYRRMADDMDLDCGAVLSGELDVAGMGRRIFEAILATASGRPTASEILGMGDEEFAPWQLGAVL